MKISHLVTNVFFIFVVACFFGISSLALEMVEEVPPENPISPRLIGCLNSPEIITVDMSSQESLKKIKWFASQIADYPTAILKVKAFNVKSDNLKALLSLLSHAYYLDLSDNNLNAEAAKMIAASDNLKELKRLDLSANKIGSEGAIAIAKSKKFKLQQLSLQNNGILIDAVLVIADSKRFNKLSLLDLSSNPIRDAGAKAIADSTKLKNLKILKLKTTEISDEGVLSILFSQHRTNLEKFQALFGNKVKISTDVIQMAHKFFPDCGWVW